MASCLRESSAFSRATKNVAQTQSELLARIVQENASTDFGIAHRFSSIANPDDFRARVPLLRYEAIAGQMEAISSGKANVLTRDEVTLLQPTSGTTSGTKLIPMTAALRAQFQKMIQAWIGDLYRHRPRVRAGRAYWSISPALPRRYTSAGIPIGFDDDAEYLTSAEQWMMRRLLVTPPGIESISDIQAFRYCTLLALLLAEDLSLISIWSPTFLLALLDSLDHWSESMTSDLARGTVSCAGEIPRPIAQWFSRRASADRARQVRLVLQSLRPTHEKLAMIWPRLALISCWTDAGAARYFEKLAAIFPHVEIQSKGLLATEGCVTFPLVEKPAPALAIRSHFFEFQPDHELRTRLAHELDRGGQYNIVLTTGGGLYRYELRDRVEVVAHEAQCPLLHFVGKADQISDLVGEKLAEPFVARQISSLLKQHGLTATFAMLIPIATPPRYRWVLQLQHGAKINPAIVAHLDDLLMENPHYAYARGLKQLHSIELCEIDTHAPSAWEIYERELLRQGARAGNIKPVSLACSTQWDRVFPVRTSVSVAAQ